MALSDGPDNNLNRWLPWCCGWLHVGSRSECNATGEKAAIMYVDRSNAKMIDGRIRGLGIMAYGMVEGMEKEP